MKPKSVSLLTLTLLVLAALACSLPMLDSSQQLPDGLVEDYSLPADAALDNTFSYSAEQQAVIQQYGSPTRFIILFEENARQETWMYDTSGYTVVFLDGVKIAEKTEAPEYRESMYATIHSPNLFYQGMTVDDIVLATGKSKFMLTSIEGMEGVRLMDLEGLSIGLLDKTISYVETIPALTESLLTPEDFVQQPNRTPEELANAGTHFYVASFTVDGESYQEDFGEIEFTFLQDEVLSTYEGETLLYNQTGPNQYYTDADGGVAITFTTEGFIMVLQSDDAEIIMTRQN